MIKLKDLLFEKVAHTKKSLEWVSLDYIPMSPKVMKQIMGDTPITVFHNLDSDSIKNKLSKVVGSKKSISSYTTDTEGHLLSGGGVQTSGGVVLEVEGKVLVAGTEDLASVPDESGRRWLAPSIFGKIVGMKQFEGGGGGIYYRKHLYNFFDTYYDKENKLYYGEDFAFSRLWTKIGGKCMALITEYITHIGEYEYSGRLIDEMISVGLDKLDNTE